jgi:hypothetical protein
MREAMYEMLHADTENPAESSARRERRNKNPGRQFDSAVRLVV